MDLTEREIMLTRPDAFAVWATCDEPAPLRFQLFDHIHYLATQIVNAIAEGRGRLIVNLPPQHGKSWFLARWLVIWYLEHNPYGRVITASYSDRLVKGHSRYVRSQFARNPRLTVELSPDSKSAEIWYTANGHGGMLATTIGGQASGFPYDLGLIDDPYKGWKDAFSPTVRRDVQNWFDAEFYTRRQEHSTIVVLHTRWHPGDLTGYLLREHTDDWTLIRLPAMAEEDDPMGRGVGDPLCPELHSRDDLMAASGSRAIWEAVYQQNPKGLGESRCYHSYTDERNLDEDVELREGVPLDLSLDFNVRPGMHAVIGQNYIEHGEDMLVAYDEIHDLGMDVRGCMDAFEDWWHQHDGTKRFGGVRIYGDVSGRSRSLTTSESCYDLVEAKLNRMGIPFAFCVPTQAPGVRTSVDDFNEAICDMDDVVHYKVRPACERLLVDLRELGTDERGQPDKSDIGKSHASDAERYRVTVVRPIPTGRFSDGGGGYSIG